MIGCSLEARRSQGDFSYTVVMMLISFFLESGSVLESHRRCRQADAGRSTSFLVV